MQPTQWNNRVFQVKAAEEALSEAEEAPFERDEWITVALLGATADPLPGAKWRPDGLIVPLDWNPFGLMLPFDQ